MIELIGYDSAHINHSKSWMLTFYLMIHAHSDFMKSPILKSSVRGYSHNLVIAFMDRHS